MADTYLTTRRYSEGLEEIARALDLAAETGEQWYVSPLLRLRASLLLHAHGPGDQAVEASLRQAIAIAR
jgi:hypothetical protein